MGKVKNDARKIAFLKHHSAKATTKYGIGGQLKRAQPKPVTRVKLKCLEGTDGDKH